MSNVVTLPIASWGATPPSAIQESSVAALEAGDVLFLPALEFAVEPREATLFTPAILGSSKNSSFDPASGRLGGTTAAAAGFREIWTNDRHMLAAAKSFGLRGRSV